MDKDGKRLDMKHRAQGNKVIYIYISMCVSEREI